VKRFVLYINAAPDGV